jgi:hypothetical protein
MGWQKLTDSTREDIVGWTTQRRHETNTGVLTKRTPAFDIDIPDQAAADAIEQLVRDRYADCGVLLSRVGKAPKRAIPFRTDTPFKKITAFLVAPGPGGEIHRLEFLGDGQQFIADGIHPDTRRPYSWFGGELGAVGRDSLPCIDETEAHQLVDDAVELLVAEHGYRLKEKTQPRPRDSDDLPPRPGDVGPRERAYAEAALRGRVADLAAMAPGSGRNGAALRAATRLGTMVAAGWIDARTVEDELAAAAEGQGKSKHNARATVRRGLGYGAQYPARTPGKADAAEEAALAAANQADDDVRTSLFGADAGTHDEAGPRRNGKDAGTAQAETQSLASRRLIKTSAEFVASLKPPDYLIKGVLQRRFLYSMTAPTGAGKTCVAMRVAAHVAFGLPLSGRAVKQGRVLFLAGENPDDVCMRWIKLAEEMGVDVNTDRIIWLGARLPLSNKAIRKQIDAEVASLAGEVALVVADTSAAFYEGDDENSNVQLGNHARMLRTFVDLPGGPTVLVTSHPVKNPDMENLVPRGGGAFVNEVDGNLVCVAQGGGLIDLHWHVKFRGPDFEPIPFKITPGQSEKLTDSDDEKIWTVTAAPVTAAEQEAVMDTAQRRRDDLTMQGQPGASLKELAEAAGWRTKEGEPLQDARPPGPEGAQGPRPGEAGGGLVAPDQGRGQGGQGEGGREGEVAVLSRLARRPRSGGGEHNFQLSASCRTYDPPIGEGSLRYDSAEEVRNTVS